MSDARLEPKAQEAAGLLAFDVDGTLVPYGGGISTRVREAMERAQAAGWRLTILTGRSWPELEPILRQVPWLEGPVACADGAVIARAPRGDLLCVRRLEREAALRAVKTLEGERALFWVYDVGQAYISWRTWRDRLAHDPVLGGASALAWLARALRFRRVGFRAVRRPLEIVERMPSPPTHITVLVRPGALQAEVERYRSLFPEFLVEAVTPGSLDLLPPGSNKGEALLEVAALHGVDPRRTVMVGDNYNDVPAFEAAGYAVVMGDAPREVRRHADVVAPAAGEDGVAWAVEHLLQRYDDRGGR
ncbi:MAG: HAD family hydrolase [Bacillota bacterium]|nr:HAD family hydrolase [Bacillota bacterium]